MNKEPLDPLIKEPSSEDHKGKQGIGKLHCFRYDTAFINGQGFFGREKHESQFAVGNDGKNRCYGQ